MRRFKTGEDLSAFVKQQTNEDILFERTIKPRLGICYMQIPNKTQIWSFLWQIGIKTEKHGNNGYYVYLV